MLTKQIKREIRYKINSGVLKKDLFNHYITEENNSELRRFLASIPNPELKRKFRALNIIVVIIWSILTLANIVTFFATMIPSQLFTVVISILFIFAIAKFNAFSYMSGIISLLISTYHSIKEVVSFSDIELEDLENKLAIYLDFGLLFIAITLMLIIKFKVFSYFIWFFPKRDSTGQFLFDVE